MKNLKLIAFFISGVLMITACNSGAQYSTKKLKTMEDSVSYYLGVIYGNNLKNDQLGDILEYDAFLKGVNDITKSDTVPVSTLEMQMYLSHVIPQLQRAYLSEEYADYISENKAFLEENATKDSIVALPNGIQYKILREGTGTIPTAEDHVKVDYAGSLINGTLFDSSYERGEPAVFLVKGVITGWQEVLKMMPVGSKWKIWIPEDLAYGSASPQGSGIIPFSTLVFEVELLEINPE